MILLGLAWCGLASHFLAWAYSGLAWPRLAWPRPGLVLAWPGLAQPHLARVADWRPEWADLLATWLSGFHVYMQGSHPQDLTKVEKTNAQGAQK